MTQQSAARADKVITSSAVPYLQTQGAQTGDTMKEGLTQLTQVLHSYRTLLPKLYLAVVLRNLFMSL